MNIKKIIFKILYLESCVSVGTVFMVAVLASLKMVKDYDKMNWNTEYLVLN